MKIEAARRQTPDEYDILMIWNCKFENCIFWQIVNHIVEYQDLYRNKDDLWQTDILGKSDSEELQPK